MPSVAEIRRDRMIGAEPAEIGAAGGDLGACEGPARVIRCGDLRICGPAGPQMRETSATDNQPTGWGQMRPSSWGQCRLSFSHEDIRTTINTYGHLVPSVDAALADGLDQMFVSSATGAREPVVGLGGR